VKTVVCLGDVVGYGPNPRECLDLVIDRCAWSLMGNHEYAVLYEPTHFHTNVEVAAYWTRGELEAEPDAEARRRRWVFLGQLDVRRSFTDEIAGVHASPRRPISEYVFPDDVTTAPNKMRQIFEHVNRCCFIGHTHVQGVFTDEPDFYPPGELDEKYGFNSRERVVINVGSVGQPRDRDPRGGYTILHGDHVEFVRVEYDIQAVVKKVEKIRELHDFFGQRLMEGR
jgi:diadenosine tetraphosphatase ApaH/serine/threonine PP2A family protein phosphatase